MANSGNPINVFSTAVGDGLSAVLAQGRGSELLVAQVHGKYFHAAARGAMFSFNATAVSVLKVASGLVAPFSLYNPIGSNRVLELATFDMGLVLAGTAVVDTLGFYSNTPVLTAKGTFTTAGTAQAALLNSGIVGVGVPYTAYTHSGTPTRWMELSTLGATTTTSNLLMHYVFDGRAVIPSGSIVSFASTATASALASSIDLDISWIETTVV